MSANAFTGAGVVVANPLFTTTTSIYISFTTIAIRLFICRYASKTYVLYSARLCNITQKINSASNSSLPPSHFFRSLIFSLA